MSLHTDEFVDKFMEPSSVDNDFVTYLLSKLPEFAVQDLVERFRIGSAEDWRGTSYCIWWQIDECMRVRAGKAMKFDHLTGKRIKDNGPAVTWMHKMMGLDGFEMSQCLFGLHQLYTSTKKICIAESEKTAVICSYFWPEYTWMASGGEGGLSHAKLEPLPGREVILHADKGCEVGWAEKADRFMKMDRRLKLRMADPLPDFLQDGDDLVDLLIRMGKL